MNGVLGKASAEQRGRAHLGADASLGILLVSILLYHLALSSLKATLKFRDGTESLTNHFTGTDDLPWTSPNTLHAYHLVNCLVE